MKNRNIIGIILIVLFSASTLIWVFNNYLTSQKKQKDEKIIDLYLGELSGLINKNKNLVLTASVLLAKDESIKKCLKTDNQNSCFKYLIKSKQGLLNTQIFDNLKIHVHDKDLKSFFRLWDPKKERDSLKSFRYSLSIVKEEKRSISCIEIGRYSMLIRGITPVFDEDKYIGSIEAITNFDSIIKHFRQQNISLYILMKNKYKNIASKIDFNNEQKLKNYILLNQTNKNISFLYDLKLDGTNYEKKGSFYLVSTPIYDIRKTIIGYYVLKLYL
ncbi:hypothetical protein CPU12_00740 [Malaciobacter molluscorum LMG 25693]|uniref:Cache sensor-containing signal transduction protein n=1 Tax=Malaciobacter molluscorum LMG 25693 TaxID=870501 RepID=A0A2G1DLH0_9BACT|nr:cache domain-containing protein [Malaciobacter molluscorum]AXX92109.1 Cache sensor-containing signal transduction protein [Malaciobacter molluscorum LMG 25693]PHO19337.1 hypothetical protein CPU12_00740 [Malaciobacter molluscorum LMG 25693]